ncbi:MMPL family transporter [Streptomyces sp. SID5464]|uniref:MMPL family transporter n=1 Tax=Streptomyces sp. SID5464 TaxID=2690293 RepID=UPI0031BA0153
MSVAGALLSRPTVDSLSIPDTESQQAIDLLDERFPEASAEGAVARVVFAAPEGGKLDRPDYRQAIGRVLSEVRDLPDVADVTDPFEDKAVSPDGRIAYAQVAYSVPRNDLADKDREALLDTAEPGTRAGLAVEFGGEAAQPRPGQGAGELIGLAAAAVVLFVTFGSFVAAGLPLLAAMLGVVFSLSMIELSTRFTDLNSDTTALALMLGLAMSIDYAMFVAFRYREELRAGEDPEHAIGTSVTTAGAAVLFAGLTTAIALAGLVVVGIPILTQVGLAAAFAVVVSTLVGLTLVPALLGFLGRRIHGRRAAHVQDKAALAEVYEEAQHRAQGYRADGKPTFGMRWVRLVIRRPVLFSLASVVVLGILAVPALDLRLGLPDDSAEPESSTSHQAYDLLTEGFGPGFNGPLTVVVDTAKSGKDARATAESIGQELSGIRGVADVSPPVPNKAGDAAVMTVVPGSGPTAAETEEVVDDIRAAVKDTRTSGEADVAVTGQTAINIDMSKRIADTLLPYLLIVVGCAFLLMIVIFRSILVPLKATLGFLLSLAATFGALVAVFQWGWLNDLLGIHSTGIIVNLLPVIVIGLSFGLAVDYEMFLVTRMREEYARGNTPEEAIVKGFMQSARVVTALALIMISVFAGFILADADLTKSFGFALAVAVFLDAFVLRVTIVPAVMALFDRAAWWLPQWLERRLPHLDIEKSDIAPPETEREVGEDAATRT